MMRGNLVYISTADILLFFIALVSFITMLVCIIKLIAAKKEKRGEMKKVKIAAGISAFFVTAFAPLTIYLIIPITPPPPMPPIETMPNITGLTYKECKEKYSDEFDLIVEEQLWSFDYPEGAIIEQYPQEGLEYLVGRTTVKCKISKGPRMITVSNVIELDFEDAKTILGDCDGFTVGYVSEYSDSVPEGKVIATDPPAFEKAVYGSAVKVTVSGGKEPDVTENNGQKGE